MSPRSVVSPSHQPPKVYQNPDQYCNTCDIHVSEALVSPFSAHYKEEAHRARLVHRVGEALQEMVPERDEKFDEDRMVCGKATY